MTDTKRIMCFGDSLTWGWVPAEHSVPTTRFPKNVRWTGALAQALGDDYEIIEEGLSARTTSLNDPTDPRLDGSAYLPSALASHLPLDLVVIMLGTNDTKAYFHRTPFDIAAGMSKLIGQILSSAGGVGTVYPAPKVLLVAPPPLAPMPDPWFAALFEGAKEKTIEMAKHYEALANFMKIDFLNAGDFITTDGCDGIHFTEENNAGLAKALESKIRQIL